MLLVAARAANGQTTEQVEGEPAVRSKNRGQRMMAVLPGLGDVAIKFG